MKKINLIIFLLLGTSSLFAKISFGSSDLNQNDELLFTISQNNAGSKNYNSLFYTKLADGESSSNPDILTCYPEQMELLNKQLNEKEIQIYKAFLKINNKHDIDSFIDYLNELVELNSPNIIVYVGNKTENYDHLSNYIKTIYSKDIYKGIKIIYKNKIYDYSLNERNV
jgi:hypothetical protein